MDWLSLSLLCALALACADAATKAWLADYRARELSLVRFGTTGLLMSPLLVGGYPWDGLPLDFWLWIIILVPLEMAAMVLYMRAIRDYPLSLTLPYLAFTPVFVVLTGYLFLGEAVDVQGVLGILLVVSGAWLLNQDRARHDDWRSWGAPFQAIVHDGGARMMLAAAFLYSLTSVMGKGAMGYMGGERFGAFYFVLLAVASVLLFAVPNPGLMIGIWRRPWGVAAVSLLNGAMVYTHFLALQQIEVAYMIAVKRTSLLFGILFGALFFHEHGLSRHILAAGLMLLGVFLIAG